MSLSFLVFWSLPASSLPPHFEPDQGRYFAISQGERLEISGGQLVLGQGADSLTLAWQGANSSIPTGQNATGGVTHYLLGPDAAQWRTAAHYGRVRIPNLYPKTDVEYSFQADQLEFDVKLSPGADARKVRFDVPGASRALDSEGNLVLAKSGRKYHLLAPLAYQLRAGVRELVECRYRLDGNAGVGFQLGPYDRSREDVIDSVLAGTGPARGL